jgi:hypothetical protein
VSSVADVEVANLFLRRKRKLRIDLGDLEAESKSLSGFLRSKLEIDVTASGNKLSIDSENLTSKELRRLVNKFIYHRNLMSKYWVAVKDNGVEIKKLRHSEKHEEGKKKATPPSTIKHGW